MPARRSPRCPLAVVALLTTTTLAVAACTETEDRPPPPAPVEAPAVETTEAVDPAPVRDVAAVGATTLTFQLHPTLGELCAVLAPKAYFAFDSARLTWGDDVVIAKVVECLQRDDMKGEELRIIGRASVIGPAKYNRELALDRARAVADGLVKAGLDRSRLTLVARGEKGFELPPKTAGLAFQRRVDLQLINPRPRTVAATYWDVDTDERMNALEFYTHAADCSGSTATIGMTTAG